MPSFPCFHKHSGSRASNQDCHRQSVTRARKQRHEQSLADVLPPSCRLCGEEAAGCGDRASPTEPVATGHCRNHQTLCHSRARKRQHGNLPLSGRDHGDRFKDGAHDATLQENERRTVRPALRNGSLPERRQLHHRKGLETRSGTIHRTPTGESASGEPHQDRLQIELPVLARRFAFVTWHNEFNLENGFPRIKFGRALTANPALFSQEGGAVTFDGLANPIVG